MNELSMNIYNHRYGEEVETLELEIVCCADGGTDASDGECCGGVPCC